MDSQPTAVTLLPNELAETIQQTKAMCPNARYVPVRTETAERILTTLAASDTRLREALENWRRNLSITRGSPVHGDALHGAALDFVIEQLGAILQDTASPTNGGEGK